MAEEQDSAQERSQEPTQKKLDESRKKGQVARSRELNTSVMLLSSAVAIFVFGEYSATSLMEILRNDFQIERASIFDTNAILRMFEYSVLSGLKLMMPIFLLLIVASFFGPLVVGGWACSGDGFKPKLSRLSVLKGFQRMFGLQGLVELSKAVGKLLLMGVGSVMLFRALDEQYLGLGAMQPKQGIVTAVGLMALVFFVLSSVTIIIALLDVPYQKFSHNQKLRMTHQEIKEEAKESQGNPEMRQKLRQLQKETSNRQMLVAVKTSDVVIVNPTHYAVALTYEAGSDDAPVVVARGVDHMAMHIRTNANQHGIPIYEAPVLSRALYNHVKLNEHIPMDLYMAVAQVLSYVYQLRKYKAGEGAAPVRPENLPVAASFRDDKTPAKQDISEDQLNA